MTWRVGIAVQLLSSITAQAIKSWNEQPTDIVDCELCRRVFKI